MPTAAVPDGVLVEATDSSPSQERLVRIAAMLRDAGRAAPPTSRSDRHVRRTRHVA